MSTKNKVISAVIALAIVGGGAFYFLNKSSSTPVTIAYQTGVDPSKVPQADGVYEKVTGQVINWRKFESGAEVVAAVASGDVPIGNIGSSPLAAAASKGLPIETFLIAGVLGQSEA